jgi:hypothetical protein
MSLLGGDGLGAFGQFAPGEQDAMLTARAHQANIRAEPDNDPIITAARMRLAHAHTIIELQIGQHEMIYSRLDQRKDYTVTTPSKIVPLSTGCDTLFLTRDKLAASNVFDSPRFISGLKSFSEVSHEQSP